MSEDWKQMIVNADNEGREPDWLAILSCQVSEAFNVLAEGAGVTAVAVRHGLPHGPRFTVHTVKVELDERVKEGRLRDDGEIYGRKYFRN